MIHSRFNFFILNKWFVPLSFLFTFNVTSAVYHINGGLRSLKYGGDFGITQSVLPAFERNSHVVRQIEAVND